MALPTSLAEVTVQVLFSGGNDMHEENLYASLLAPFALGIPSERVQLFCSDLFLNVEQNGWVNAAGKINLAEGFLPPFNVYGTYFMEIHSRGTKAVAPLPDCGLRFICGHGYGGASGYVSVRCGEALMQVKDIASAASILTVLDICNAPNAVHGIEGGPTALSPREDVTWDKKTIFDDLSFPVVSTKSCNTHTFRVSWVGHKNVDASDPAYKPEWPRMSLSIGFPSMASLLVAVKNYVGSDKTRPLGEIYVEQYRSIETRYVYEAGKAKKLKRPHFQQLENLQNLLGDDRVVNLNAEAFNCELLNRSGEWFLTTELTTTLPRVEVKLATFLMSVIALSVAQWHQENPGKFGNPYQGSERDFQRLKMILGPFRHDFIRMNLVLYENHVYVRENDDECEGGWLIEDWAVSCPSFSTIVEKALLCVESGSTKALEW